MLLKKLNLNLKYIKKKIYRNNYNIFFNYVRTFLRKKISKLFSKNPRRRKISKLQKITIDRSIKTNLSQKRKLRIIRDIQKIRSR